MMNLLKKKKTAGFSLVELIIVIAIMVALVGVLAPTYTKYIRKSRDAVIMDAAEQCATFIRAEYGMGINGEGTVRIGKGLTDNTHIDITFCDVQRDDGSTGPCTLSYLGKSGDEGLAEFKKALNFKENQICKTDLVYYIHVRTYDIDARLQFQIEEETTRST